MKRSQRRFACFVAALCAMPVMSLAQTYPAKPVRMVLSLGGGTEVAARLLAQKLTAAFGQPVLVETQPGAGGTVGAEAVARSAPDGYTLLLASASTHVFAVHLSKNLRYDPVRDFTPITRVFGAVLCIAAGPASPARSLGELIDYARRNPGKISYGTSGVGTGQHLAAETIKLLTGTDMVHVPYKSGAQVTTDLVGGQIPVSFGVFATAAPYVKSGKLRLLAVMEERRYPAAPDVPTVREIFPAFENPPTWVGFFGPAGLPQPISRRLHEEMVRAVTAPDLAPKFEDIGFSVTTDAPGEFSAVIRRDIELVGRMVKAAGVQPE
jgi:tripartite-type tricarboxylate transporter receptor subunit TctC